MIHITWTYENNFLMTTKGLVIPRIGDIVNFTIIEEGGVTYKINDFGSSYKVKSVKHEFYLDHGSVHNIENHVVFVTIEEI